MKKTFLILILLSLTVINIPSVMAQAPNSQSLNGSTGLYSIPTGHIGWENGGNFGLDFGYRTIINNEQGITHIPALTMSLFKIVEISAAFDLQPDFRYTNDPENDDLLFGLKIRLPTSKNTNIAIGTNFQLINFDNDIEYRTYNAYQPYIAITYPGTFFTTTAETTVVFGKTFYSGGPDNNSNIDFGMGFDMILFPDVFGKAVHWLIDFSNFSYSDNAWPHNTHNNFRHGGPAWWRGVLNTGFRIDLSTIPALSKIKFLIDAVFNDLFDDGQRSFTIGVVLGFNVS